MEPRPRRDSRAASHGPDPEITASRTVKASTSGTRKIEVKPGRMGADGGETFTVFETKVYTLPECEMLPTLLQRAFLCIMSRYVSVPPMAVHGP